MLATLERGMSLPPVSIRLIEAQQLVGPGMRLDALVEATWGAQAERFAVEMKSGSQPSLIDGAAMQAERGAQALGVRPIVFVPYLSEESLTRLAAREISGIDLCGNAVILGATFSVWRSGAPNRYPDSRPIQNPYAGDSSVFARAFLLQPDFGSLKELREFAQAKSEFKESGTRTKLLLGTASKIVSALEEELIVMRTSDGIKLVDARRLLKKLRERYRRIPTQSLQGKTPFSTVEIWKKLAVIRAAGRTRSVATGIASAGHYGVLSGVERPSLYVDDVTMVANQLEVKPGRAFANIELIEDRRDLRYFDARAEGDATWASPIQTWLELSQAGPREHEAGESLERQILADLGGENT